MVERVLWPIAFGLAGLLVGWIYFRIMWYAVAQLTEHKGGGWQFAALLLVRAALLAGGAFGASKFGLWPLVAYMVAFFAARTVIVGRARHEPSQEDAEAND